MKANISFDLKLGRMPIHSNSFLCYVQVICAKQSNLQSGSDSHQLPAPGYKVADSHVLSPSETHGHFHIQSWLLLVPPTTFSQVSSPAHQLVQLGHHTLIHTATFQTLASCTHGLPTTSPSLLVRENLLIKQNRLC